MDDIDWKIVAALEQDGRISFAELAEQVGLSKSPCWQRVQRMQDKGIISGFSTLFEPTSLGLGVQCYVAITIGFDAHSEFEQAVSDHDAIIECFTTAGSSDYFLKVYAKSVAHIDDLLRYEISKLPGVQSSETTICLKTIKSNGSLVNCSRPRN
ncbi:Lrp/AsnC family transcriptional regulator [Kordiimonas sp. SCSIO 12610]|uniref:Lrp/AsnC family transcriptional regulator n=1 Tax=Kordiimonas sp. SCSIO 12610 TaxID=2829597 RepID=UPI002109A65A|nr:Lrp/AsnC family transcriptional regulator [Kordiimonas sp. SCSIO 12610]UTW54712.1 Lrp/AsnC family transcriptional regulator [Kordiimonas sp. SCSIO 12610]